MRVKVGSTWYDCTVEPVAVELTAEDRKNIANMAPDATRYAVLPDDAFPTPEAAWRWVAEEPGPTEICGIPLAPVLGRIKSSKPWATWFAGFDNSVTDVCPEGTTQHRARALMRLLDRLGYVEGCHCGCRGDYELTKAGERLHAWLSTENAQ